MPDIESYFRETGEGFTIFVCEQRFAVGQGYEYFKQFKGKENLISSDTALRGLINKVLSWTEKKVPNIAELIKQCFFSGTITPVNVLDIITTLSKLFTANEHQAAGPNVIDPIIIQEGVSTKYLAQLIALHKESILRPAIIILLKDNNFERALSLLSKCPHGINVKMIRNSGQCENFKIINCGADHIGDFLDSYSLQCFSTCSCTKKNILLNEEWAQDSLVRQYSPLILKIRSNLLLDNKEPAKSDLDTLIKLLDAEHPHNEDAKKLWLSFQCVAKLSQVYSRDRGGKELEEAKTIADALNVPLLMAHINRYANMFTNLTLSEKEQMLTEGRKIFYDYGIEDHAVYCENNILINQFYAEYIDVQRFRDMQQEALNNVPGLVGMSLILNNTGVAHLYAGQPEKSIEYFKKGLDYAQERIVQRLGLMTNTLLARSYCRDTIPEKDVRFILDLLFDQLGEERLPFLSANYIMNILAVLLVQNSAYLQQIMIDYPILSVLQNAMTPNQFGSGSLALQMHTLGQRYPTFHKLGFECILVPSQRTNVSGIRERFINNHGMNPSIFNAWL